MVTGRRPLGHGPITTRSSTGWAATETMSMPCEGCTPPSVSGWPATSWPA